jgi:hypothetical protein
MSNRETKKRKRRVVDSDDVSDEDNFEQNSERDDEDIVENDIEDVPKSAKKSFLKKSTSSLRKSSDQVVIHDGKHTPA